jgi:hypothetical protein
MTAAPLWSTLRSLYLRFWDVPFSALIPTSSFAAEPGTQRVADGSQSGWLAPALGPTVDVGCVRESTQTWV